jgi:hypothetical protein
MYMCVAFAGRTAFHDLVPVVVEPVAGRSRLTRMVRP